MDGLSWSTSPPDAFFLPQNTTTDMSPPPDAFSLQRSASADMPPPPDAFKRHRTTSDTLNRLASFIARAESKQVHVKPCRTPPPPLPPQTPAPAHAQAEWACPEGGRSFPCAQSALPKPHRCHGCGTEFSLRSSLQMHECGAFPRGTPHSPSYATALVHQETPTAMDSSPYACAPCGRGFMLKQALLHHQQAGCGKAASPPQTDHAHSPLSPASEEENSCSSSSPLYGPERRPERAEAERPDPRRADSWENEAHTETRSKRTAFGCRSCEMVFSSTATLSKHRREQHRRGLKLTAELQLPAVKHKRYNSTNNTYTCQVCSQVFFHHLSLWAHKKKHPALSKDKHCSSRSDNATSRKLLPTASAANKLSPPKAFARGKAKKFPAKFHKFHKSHKLLPQLSSLRAPKRTDDDEEEEEEEEEFPCPSCPEVFSRHSDLSVHAELHQAAVRRSQCSVCEKEMDSRRWSSSKRRLRLYHCLLCQSGFSSLETFLSHCQSHLKERVEQERSDRDAT